MTGLLSQFGESLAVAVAVALATLVVAAVAGLRARRSGGPAHVLAARVMAVGSALVAVVATALPRAGFRLEPDGDLVLQPGRGGLGDLDQIWGDPGSLAGVLLLANVVLYTPIAFSAALGWVDHRRKVLPGCMVLSIAVEAVQYTVLGRVAAIDDVILNLSGALLGYLGALLLLGRLRARPARS